MIEKISIYGSSNIGVFISPTDEYVLIPSNLPPKIVDIIRDVLRVKVIEINLCDSVLLGVLTVGNSRGLLTPYYTPQEDIVYLKSKLKVNIDKLPCKITALGNVILANDHAAIVSPELDDNCVKIIEDVLDVEVEKLTIAGFKVVGSVAVANNNGCIVHPLAAEKELKSISEILKVKVDVGTVNAGFPIVGVGIVANSNGILIGDLSTGPEMAHIEKVLKNLG
ncbi:MAG: translation initiation factor IF-6 [Candidatus Methanomethylicia archaeon]|nr:translation initiation factor IF-6 [Candidatus Methanomethylicia archaeon]MCX8169297.1 translation initiation factor IF-6 [Candidatus Methanomethylicia archaeon]MDW7988920.1 translation initiation factor IF-6 [Nitrososphaerota archaeon]